MHAQEDPLTPDELDLIMMMENDIKKLSGDNRSLVQQLRKYEEIKRRDDQRLANAERATMNNQAILRQKEAENQILIEKNTKLDRQVRILKPVAIGLSILVPIAFGGGVYFAVR